MYFITYGGLSVYDGIKFSNYRREDGLVNELVNDILEITPDSILVATNSASLNTLVKGKTGLFNTSDNFYPVTNQFLKSQDGSIYVAADNGLFRLDGNKFTNIPLINKDGKNIGTNLERITEWKQYFFLIPWNMLQEEKCIIYDKEKKVVVGTIPKKIYCTGVSPSGDLWVNSSDGMETIDLPSLDKGILSFKSVPPYPGANIWEHAYFYFDESGGTWIFQNNQVIHMPLTGTLQTFSSAQGLRTSNLTYVFVDREGITWMSSDGNGVVKMPGTNIQILNEILPGVKNNISAMSEQADTIWIFNNTDNSFYRIYKDKVTNYKMSQGSPNVVSIHLVGSKLYYIANHKIYVIEHKDQASSYEHPVLVFPIDTKVLEIGTGLVDTYGNIIQCIRQDDATFYLVVIGPDKVYMKLPVSFTVDQMVIDKNGYLWVAMRDNHLKAYSLHPENPEKYLRAEYDYSDKIEGIGPRSVSVDSSGNVWVGTRYNGLYCLQFEEKKYKSSFQLTTADGLTDNFHYHLYCDPHDNIWAGSQTGLDKISLKNGEYVIENVTKSKNIFQGIFKMISGEDGSLWAMTSNGDIIKVSNQPHVLNAPVPSLFITSVSVNDSLYREGIEEFQHSQNNFSISVAAPSFIDEKSIMYSYQLKGSGKGNWSNPSNNAQFNFINLAPGHYTLNVKAEFPGKVYPTQQLKYSFLISPPFWQQWWFIALAWMMILAFLGLIVRYYYNRKFEIQKISLERKQAIEKERTRIATDMHDDLGAGLSRIKFLSETIGIKKQMNQPIEAEINNIRQYAHDMIDKMGEIVWALNEKNDSLSDLLSYTRAYAVEYLAENGIRSHIEKIPPFNSIMVNGEFRRNIYLSVKEALHNVIKHARANEVSIQFLLSDNLVINIQDDGVGFNGQFNNQYANGLSNMKKRMSEIGGNIDITSHQGTRVVLTAPLHT